MEFFLLDTLKTTFWMENWTQRWKQWGPFFPKTGLPLHSGWIPVRVVKYASTSLTIHKYPWKYLNKLFYARALNMLDYLTMFDRLLKMPWVLNAPGFWIWHGCYKGYTEFWTWVNMAQYASIIPEYALMSHNVSENCWILLNVPEYTSKCLSVLNMPRHLRYLTKFWISLRN